MLSTGAGYMMGKNGKPRSDPEGSTGGLQTAELAADLNAVVDRLEGDWRSGRWVFRDTAQQLHDLRAKAEQLFGDGR